MNNHGAKVLARWDSEGSVWVATSHDIPGLVLAAPAKPELVEKIKLVAIDLIEANGGDNTYDHIIIEYIEEEIVRPLRAA